MKNLPPIKQKYLTVEEFAQIWEDYKTHVQNNPDIEEVVTVKGDVVLKKNERPLIRQGFEAYAYEKLGHHISQYIDNTGGAYEAYFGVVTYIRKQWEGNQISGSLTGKFKSPNLVARLNGLTEKTENKHDHTGEIEIRMDLSK